MVEEEIVIIARFLSHEPLFQGLDVDQIRWIAEKFIRLPVFKDGIVVRFEEEAQDFYIVFSGKFSLNRPQREGEEQVTFLIPGEHFGEDGFLFSIPQPYTVQAFENSEVIKLTAEEFESVLEEYPQLRGRLTTTASSRRVRNAKFTKWIQPEETTLLVDRKHWIFLMQALFWPVALGAIFLALLAYAFSIGNDILIFVSSGLITLMLIWFFWRILDWRNDYFILTSRRVVSLQKVIGIYDNRTESPLSSIIANDVTRSFLGQILNFGDINVRSYMGNFVLKGVPKPFEMVSLIEGHKEKTIRRNKMEEQRRINKAVEDALNGQNQPQGWDTVQPIVMAKSPTQVKTPKKRLDMGKSIRTLIMMRFEDQGVITYRRHWYALVGKIWWQVFLILIISFLSSFLATKDIPALASCSIGSLVNLILFGVIIYRTWDWANDIFQLTQTQIIDIDKKPLGAEGKKTASLDAPDFRIEHVRPSLLANLLNFGNVIVYIGQTTFNIEGVFNPDQVHTEIAAQRQALLSKREDDRVKGDNDRMVTWLMALYNQAQKRENDGGETLQPPV